MPNSPWKINPYQCLEAPAVTILFYHNTYEEGKQGGFEIIQRSVRIAGNGNLRLEVAPGQWGGLPHNGTRQLSEQGQGLSIHNEYTTVGIAFDVHLRPEGEALNLSIDLEGYPKADPSRHLSFNLELIPGVYMGRSFILDDSAGIFPRQFDAPLVKADSGNLEPQPLAHRIRLVVSPEGPDSRLEIESLTGELSLLDGRARAQNGWFVVHGQVPASGHLEWRITPTITSGWRRLPVIGYSQVGYHPDQKKVSTIELDPQVTHPGRASLLRLNGDGSEDLAKAADLALWGEYLCYNYALFNFSEVRQPGLYRIRYEDQASDPFPIHSAVYQNGVWQPTLETYFPVQMCHVEVRDGSRVWHGTCHLDDALQAPTGHNHFDGYKQFTETETSYAPLQHIPHLDRGGWHDAGDYDLAAGSQAQTTLALALAREAFGTDSDQTTVDRPGRKVTLHAPDGIPDILQQIAHGVENLLSGYRAAGHSFVGIIENNLKQYTHLGDPATMTDNQVCEGISDDRWAFTNQDTALEYQVCAALAASGRVLVSWDAPLAEECLQKARQIWEHEQGHPAREANNAYTPRHSEWQAVLAAVELMLATGDDQYRLYLLGKLDLVCENMSVLGGSVARGLVKLHDTAFEGRFRSAAQAYAEKLAAEARQNPFGIPYPAETWRNQSPVWGVAWNFLQRSVGWYFLRRAYPVLFPLALLTDTLGYVLGCHPASNASLVSGVGANSLTVAYGINRADWTYIPGGVVSGPALLRPNYPELHDPFPFLWQQKEYVMGGAANYLFLALAVMRELS